MTPFPSGKMSSRHMQCILPPPRFQPDVIDEVIDVTKDAIDEGTFRRPSSSKVSICFRPSAMGASWQRFL
jgi:hypothetical protein